MMGISQGRADPGRLWGIRMAERPSTKDILAAIRQQGGADDQAAPAAKSARPPKTDAASTPAKPKPKPKAAPGEPTARPAGSAEGAMSVGDKLAAIRGGGGGSMSVGDKLAAIRGGTAGAAETAPARPAPAKKAKVEEESAPAPTPHAWGTLAVVMLGAWAVFTAGLLALGLVLGSTTATPTAPDDRPTSATPEG